MDIKSFLKSIKESVYAAKIYNRSIVALKTSDLETLAKYIESLVEESPVNPYLNEVERLREELKSLSPEIAKINSKLESIKIDRVDLETGLSKLKKEFESETEGKNLRGWKNFQISLPKRSSFSSEYSNSIEVLDIKGVKKVGFASIPENAVFIETSRHIFSKVPYRNLLGWRYV